MDLLAEQPLFQPSVYRQKVEVEERELTQEKQEAPLGHLVVMVVQVVEQLQRELAVIPILPLETEGKTVVMEESHKDLVLEQKEEKAREQLLELLGKNLEHIIAAEEAVLHIPLWMTLTMTRAWEAQITEVMGP